MGQNKTSNLGQNAFGFSLAVLGVVAGIALWLLRNNQQVGDSLGIAYFIKLGNDIPNPHHILFSPIVTGLHHFASFLFGPIDVLVVGQAHNIFWSIIALLSFSAVVKHTTQNNSFALLAAILLLISHQFWQYSTQFEVYIPALGCLALLLALWSANRNKDLSVWLTVASTLLLVLSIGYHQMGVLFVGPMMVLAYCYWGKKGAYTMFKSILAAGTICITLYLSVYLNSYSPDISVRGFLKYCVIYAYSNPDWGTFSHFAKGSEVARIFQNTSGAFLAAYWAAKIPVWLTASSFLLTLLVNITAIAKKHRNAGIRVAMITWLAIDIVFLIWWTPGYEFFAMLVWPMLALALLAIHDLAMLAKGYTWLPATILAVAIAGLLYLNQQTFAHYHNQHDEGYNKAQELMALNDGDCHVVANFNIILNLNYFHDFRKTIESDGLAIDYYYRDSLPLHSKFDNMPCVLMELWYFNPWYQPMEHNGYSKPADWLRMNRNLFNFEVTILDLTL